MRIKFVLILMFGFFLSGCFGEVKMNYEAPNGGPDPQKTIFVNESKEIVWKKIINGIGKTFFNINNLNKESGFINIGFTGDPEDFLECGQIVRIKTDGSDRSSGKKKIPAAQRSYIYKSQYGRLGYLRIKRAMSFEGRINIVLNEIEENRTQVAVNVKYVVNKKLNGWDAAGLQVLSNDDSMHFNSNSFGYFSDQYGTHCYSNGEVEKLILNIAKGP